MIKNSKSSPGYRRPGENSISKKGSLLGKSKYNKNLLVVSLHIEARHISPLISCYMTI